MNNLFGETNTNIILLTEKKSLKGDDFAGLTPFRKIKFHKLDRTGQFLPLRLRETEDWES